MITATEQAAHPTVSPGPSHPGECLTRRAVTTVLTVIALLTFTFSFGNVWALGLRLGVPNWIAPLIGPAVDLSVTGLLVGVRYLALHGASAERLREARLLLVFSGLVCLALNTAGPIGDRAFGRAAFDAVGPLLLLGWAEVGPALLRQIHAIQPITPVSTDRSAPTAAADARTPTSNEAPAPVEAPESAVPVPTRTETQRTPDHTEAADHPERRRPAGRRTIRLAPEVVLQARRIDAEHRTTHDRPASAATLRAQLHIGGPESNRLVKIVRGRMPDPTASSTGPKAAPVRTDADLPRHPRAGGPAAPALSARTATRRGRAQRTTTSHERSTPSSGHPKPTASASGRRSPRPRQEASRHAVGAEAGTRHAAARRPA
jgi:hypothetical protein